MSNIVIIGSGPAGVSAALYAARAGVQTTVLTKGPGALDRAELIQNYYGFAEPITGAELERRGIEGAKAVGVEFVTTEAVGLTYTDKLTVETLDGDYPADAVILATGSNPMFLPIPGLNNREYVKTAIEVLRGRTLYGKKVVVAGGGMTGAETAVFLAVQGCDVTIIEMAPDIITDAVAQPRACLLEHIRKYNIKVHTHTKLTKVGEGTIYAEEYGEPVEFKHIDMLVNAMGVRSNNPLEAELKDCGCKVVVVGDASSTKNGYKNIREGFNAGNAV